MDGESAPPPSYNAAPEIPTDIFRPLLAIAQLHYDANDVKRYYLTMLRHLRRMGTVNADAAYTILSPLSDRKTAFSSDEDDQVSPKTIPANAEPTFEPSYEPGQNDQLHIAIAAQQSRPVAKDGPREPESESPPALPPRHDSHHFCDSPPEEVSMILPTTQAPHEQHAVRAASLPLHQVATPHQPHLTPWASAEQYQFSPYLSHQQPRGFVQQPVPSPIPYHASVNNARMPLYHSLSTPPPHQYQQLYQQSYPTQLYPQQHYPQQQMYEAEPEGLLGLSRLADNFDSLLPTKLQKGVRRFTGVM